MRTNHIKQALREGRATFGCWLSLGDLCATRVLARVGFDWLTVDLEHAPIDWSQAAMLFAAIADAGCAPIARVPQGTGDYIKRVLDAGAWGIVVPMVNTVEQAEVAIRAAKYPPLGNRSLGGTMHAMNFDATSAEYYRHANDEIIVILQTESTEGVENADQIYQLPGIDVAFVGPADLRAQMRRPDGSEATDEEYEKLIAHVVDAGKRAGIATGMLCFDPASALARAEQGMQLLGVGSDARMMTAKAQEFVAALGIQQPGAGAGGKAKRAPDVGDR